MLSPATLRRRYMDETVRLRGGARVRIVERPGIWMAPDERRALVDDLQRVVRAAVPAGSLDYGAASGDPERLAGSVLTVVYAPGDDRPIAFNALAFLDCELHGRPIDVLHLGLVMIDPGARASGLSGVLYGLTCFLLFARRQLRPLWVSNVTQVPAVFGMVSESFENVYPTCDPAGRQSFAHLQLARQIMARHRHVFGVGADAELDEERGIIRNAYTGGSDNLKKRFADAPKHRHEQHNAWCERMLDYGRGDDVLQLGQFTLRAARSYYTRSARALSPGALALSFATRALESLVAPVVQWLDARHSMGALRPALPILRSPHRRRTHG